MDESQKEINPVEELVEQVAKDLELNQRELLDVQLQLYKNFLRSIPALRDSINTGRLFSLVHPFIAERISEKIIGDGNGFVDFEEPDGPLVEIQNAAKFKNPAIFVHRIAPVPGTFKGKITCTWALDVASTCRVTDLTEKLASYLKVDVDCIKLIFNGLILKLTNTLEDYDVRGGDTIYLYTVTQKCPEGECYWNFSSEMSAPGYPACRTNGYSVQCSPTFSGNAHCMQEENPVYCSPQNFCNFSYKAPQVPFYPIGKFKYSNSGGCNPPFFCKNGESP